MTTSYQHRPPIAPRLAALLVGGLVLALGAGPLALLHDHGAGAEAHACAHAEAAEAHDAERGGRAKLQPSGCGACVLAATLSAAALPDAGLARGPADLGRACQVDDVSAAGRPVPPPRTRGPPRAIRTA